MNFLLSARFSDGAADQLAAAIIGMVRGQVNHALAGGFRDLADVDVCSSPPDEELVSSTAGGQTEVKSPRGEAPAFPHADDVAH